MAGSQAAAAPGTPPLLQKQALPVYPQQGAGQGQSLHEENGTYGVTKHLVHTEQGPGRVRRVSAAVVVNDRSDDRRHGQAGACGVEATKRGRDASAGGAGAGCGWLRCKARRPSGDGERELQHERS